MRHSVGILRHMPGLPRPADVRLPSRYFKLILRHFGGSPELRAAILEGTGLCEADLDDPSLELSLAQQINQHRNMIRLFGESWVVDVPEIWGYTLFGSLSAASQYATNLDDALAGIVSYGKTIGNIWTHALVRRGNRSALTYSPAVDMPVQIERKCLEIGFVSLKALFFLYLTREPAGVEFSFRCDEPAYLGAVRAALGDGVRFGQSISAVEFPTAWLAERSPLHDAAALRFAITQLQAEYAALSHSAPITTRVEHALRAATERRPTQSMIADRLGLTERTMVRRLAAANTSFRALLDEELRLRAEEYASLGSLKLADVGEKLGYGDPSSFARARRRWAARSRP